MVEYQLFSFVCAILLSLEAGLSHTLDLHVVYCGQRQNDTQNKRALCHPHYVTGRSPMCAQLCE